MIRLFPFETPASIVGTDGNTLRIEVRDPASDREIQSVSNEIGKKLPEELARLLRASNGFSFYGVPIHGTDEMYVTAAGELVFHDWGTGDVDCVDCDTGRVVFRGHDPFPELEVASTVMRWFQLVLEDIQRWGVVYDVYSSVANGVDSFYGRASRQH